VVARVCREECLILFAIGAGTGCGLCYSPLQPNPSKQHPAEFVHAGHFVRLCRNDTAVFINNYSVPTNRSYCQHQLSERLCSMYQGDNKCHACRRFCCLRDIFHRLVFLGKHPVWAGYFYWHDLQRYDSRLARQWSSLDLSSFGAGPHHDHRVSLGSFCV
jgi:hypothetical protein